MVIATTTTQLSLSWTITSNGNSPITMVMITYQLTGSQNVTQTANNTFTSHTITGLMPNMEYTIFLQSFNAIGGSGSVSITGMTEPLRKCYHDNVTTQTHRQNVSISTYQLLTVCLDTELISSMTINCPSVAI